MRAFSPRFERPSFELPKISKEAAEENNKSENKRPEEKSRRIYQIPETKRQGGKTFAEALRGKICSLDPPADEVISFQSNEEEIEWLKKSFTGFVKSEFIWEEIEQEINSECAESLKISTLGGNLVLIQSQNRTPVQELIKDLDEWANFWFEWFRPWSYVDVNSQRSVWTKWYGVPLQAWNRRFFDIVSARMGRMLNIHEDSKTRNRLDVAFVQISTGLAALVNTFECKINGAKFKIRVEEIGDHETPGKFVFSDEETDSEEGYNSEEENEVSASPAMAQIDRDVEKSQCSGEICSKPNESGDPSNHIQNAANTSPIQKDCTQEQEGQSFRNHASQSDSQENLNKGVPNEICSRSGCNKTRSELLQPRSMENPNPRVVEVESVEVESLSLVNSYGQVLPNLGCETEEVNGMEIILEGEVVEKRSVILEENQRTLIQQEANSALLEGQGQRGELTPERQKGSGWNKFKSKKKNGGEVALKRGINRFLHKRIKKNSSKMQSRKEGAEKRVSIQNPQIEAPGEENTSGERVDAASEGVRKKITKQLLEEGAKIWEFGKEIGLSSNQEDIVLAEQIMGCQSEKRVGEKSNMCDQ